MKQKNNDIKPKKSLRTSALQKGRRRLLLGFSSVLLLCLVAALPAGASEGTSNSAPIHTTDASELEASSATSNNADSVSSSSPTNGDNSSADAAQGATQLNQSDYAPGGILFALEQNSNPAADAKGNSRNAIKDGNLAVHNTLQYDDPQNKDPLHPDRIHITMGGYFDLSNTDGKKVLNSNLDTWGTAWMALWELPPYLSTDNILAGVNKAYSEHPEDFQCITYKGVQYAAYSTDATPLVKRSFNNTGFISTYDGRDHTDKSKYPHTLQLKARGDSISFSWKDLYDIWWATTSEEREDMYISLEFDIDVHAATAEGLASSENNYFDQSPDASLTTDILPPAENGSLSFPVKFYDYNKVMNDTDTGIFHWSATSEIHIAQGQENSPTFTYETAAIATWCYYLSPWDATETYNTQFNSIGDVLDAQGSVLPAVLPGDYLQPSFIWNPERDGYLNDVIADLTNMKRFGRVVNIMQKRSDSEVGSLLEISAYKDSGGNYLVTYEAPDSISSVDNTRTWNSFFRDRTCVLTIYDPLKR